MDVRYLNVDCILRSDRDLGALLEHLGDDIFLLWHESGEGGSFVGFETNLAGSRGPHEDIAALLKLFSALPPELSRLLRTCHERVFDIGFEGGNVGDPVDMRLDSSLLGAIVESGFSINIRVYPGTVRTK